MPKAQVGATLVAMEAAGGSQPAGDRNLPHWHTASLAYRQQAGSHRQASTERGLRNFRQKKSAQWRILSLEV